MHCFGRRTETVRGSFELEKRQLIIRQDRTEDKIIRTRRQNKKRFVLMVLI